MFTNNLFTILQGSFTVTLAFEDFAAFIVMMD